MTLLTGNLSKSLPAGQSDTEMIAARHEGATANTAPPDDTANLTNITMEEFEAHTGPRQDIPATIKSLERQLAGKFDKQEFTATFDAELQESLRAEPIDVPPDAKKKDRAAAEAQRAHEVKDALRLRLRHEARTQLAAHDAFVDSVQVVSLVPYTDKIPFYDGFYAYRSGRNIENSAYFVKRARLVARIVIGGSFLIALGSSLFTGDNNTETAASLPQTSQAAANGAGTAPRTPMFYANGAVACDAASSAEVTLQASDIQNIAGSDALNNELHTALVAMQRTGGGTPDFDYTTTMPEAVATAFAQEVLNKNSMSPASLAVGSVFRMPVLCEVVPTT